MSVKIRLRRTGKRNAPAHRIVVVDSRSPRDGRFIENIGMYDPRAKVEQIDLARVDYWLSHGAQASTTVGGIVKRARDGVSLYDRRLQREAEQRRKAEEEAGLKAEEAETEKQEAAEADRKKVKEEAAAETEAAEAKETGEEDAGAAPAADEQEKTEAEDKSDK